MPALFWAYRENIHDRYSLSFDDPGVCYEKIELVPKPANPYAAATVDAAARYMWECENPSPGFYGMTVTYDRISEDFRNQLRSYAFSVLAFVGETHMELMDIKNGKA